jgi:hypothetical protein
LTQGADGPEKTKPAVVHEPSELIAVPTAAEAVTMITVNPERWRALVVEGAERDEIVAASAYRYPLRDQSRE